MPLFRWFALFWMPLYLGGGGPSKSQKRAQKEQRQLAQEAADREVAREESLKIRVLARQRARRFGQFGRRSLAFNPGIRDLTTVAPLARVKRRDEKITNPRATLTDNQRADLATARL